MNNFAELARTRRSIRKFDNTPVPQEDIEYFIKAAVTAPSGCNSQCWKFVAVSSSEVIKSIETAVINKVNEILEIKKDELPEKYMVSKAKMLTFFAKAPVIIAVFLTDSEYYDELFISVLKARGYDDKSIKELLANYELLSIGAAVQNLLLAVHEKGYGACWMNDPAIAGAEINKILDVQPEHKFISLIPVGKPAYTPREKKMKDFDEVFKYIG